jgi:hypothetical protein
MYVLRRETWNFFIIMLYFVSPSPHFSVPARVPNFSSAHIYTHIKFVIRHKKTAYFLFFKAHQNETQVDK